MSQGGGTSDTKHSSGDISPALADTAEGSVVPAVSAAPVPASVSDSGQRYELLEPIGKGGMGEVFKARDRRLNRLVAIKFLRTGHENATLRFQQEARAQARIEHPNVCKVHEVGDMNGRPYIAMELVGGLPLHKVMDQLRLEEKLCIVRDAAEALNAAHRLGIIHRDVKPSNLLVQRREDGTWFPVVMDFGLAHDPEAEQQLTRSGVVMGTPAYMAPEQARGDARNLDRRTDVYALGATLFELLTGRAPFIGDNQTVILLQVLSREPPSPRLVRPELPQDLETIVLKCLQKEPTQRYESARALAEDLQRYLNGEPILGRRVSLWYRLRRQTRRHRAVVVTGVIAFIGIAVLGAYGIQARLEVRREQTQAGARAKLSQELGQTIKEMEWFIRAVHDLPPHDTTYANVLLQARIQKLKALQHGLGRAGDGLVQYALGNAYVALQDFDRAYEHFSEALRKGNDSPELRGALGRVLGEQYKKKLEQALRTGDVGFVKAQKRELRAKYIEPAIAFLRGSQEAEPGAPQLLDALLALYDERFDEARRKAEEVSARAPWVYQAKQLAGDAHVQQALNEKNQADYKAAIDSLHQAIKKYKEAVEIGRSDVLLYESIAECYLQLSEIIINLQGKFEESELLDMANRHCEKAIIISPNRQYCYSKIGRAYSYMSYIDENLDRSPEQNLNLLLKISEPGIRLDSTDSDIYDSIGTAYLSMARYELRHSLPAASRHLDLSIDNLHLSLKQQSRFPAGLTDLSNAHRNKGISMADNLDASIREFRLALKSSKEAYSIDPSYHAAFDNLGWIYRYMISTMVSFGKDPSDVAREMRNDAHAFLARKLRVPGALFPIFNSQHIYTDYHILKGDESSLAQARAEMRALAEQAEQVFPPDSPELALVRMYRAYDEAALLLSRKQDPTLEVQTGRRALGFCADLNSQQRSECYRVASGLSLIAAMYAEQCHQSVLPFIQRAISEARQAIALFPLPDHIVQLVATLLHMADAQKPRPAPSLLAEGLKITTDYIASYGDIPNLLTQRGRFRLLRAESLPSGKERVSFAQKAEEDFAAAVKKNPLLARKYAPFIELAQSFAAKGAMR